MNIKLLLSFILGIVTALVSTFLFGKRNIPKEYLTLKVINTESKELNNIKFKAGDAEINLKKLKANKIVYITLPYENTTVYQYQIDAKDKTLHIDTSNNESTIKSITAADPLVVKEYK